VAAEVVKEGGVEIGQGGRAIERLLVSACMRPTHATEVEWRPAKRAAACEVAINKH
jgi:hypothetical protein